LIYYHSNVAFVLFREPPNFTLPEGASELELTIEARRRWDAAKFGERNGLQTVGAAFYLMRGEDWVVCGLLFV
jgi:hypothetical protein